MQNFKFFFVESDDQINTLTKYIIELDNLPIKAHFEKNPMTALAYLEQLDQSQFPDVILVGNNLCFMTGLEFADEYLRKFYHYNSDTQLYLTSSYCSVQTMAQIIKTPEISGFIAQPFSKKTFLERIVPNIQVSVI